MSDWILVDGNNVMFAHQHGSSKLMAGEQETTAIYGFLVTLRRIQERFPNGRIIVLWDHSPSWRFDIYPEYKGKRDLNPALVKAKQAVSKQQPILKRGLSLAGVIQCSSPKMEADDLAAWFVDQASKRNKSVVMISGDNDWIQLVRENVIWTNNDNTKDRVVTIDTFYEDTGFRNPKCFLDAKCIIGDVGDNVPGVPGLGEKAAQLILDQFDSFPDFIAAWPNFKLSIEPKTPWARYINKVEKFLDISNGMEIYAFAKKMMELKPDVVKDFSFMKERSHYQEDLFKNWLGQNAFGSILRNYTNWINPMIKSKTFS